MAELLAGSAVNIAIILLAWCLSIGGVYLYGVSVGDDHATAAVSRENDIARIAREAGQRGAAEAIAANKPRNVTIRQETEREIQTNTVYRDCRHSPEQLRRLNAALTGDDPEQPAGSGLVPKAGPLVGRQLRGDDAQADRSGAAVPRLSSGSAGRALD